MLGVSEGLNIGIRNANGHYIILLNNDLIVAPNWLDYLFEAYKKMVMDYINQNF